MTGPEPFGDIRVANLTQLSWDYFAETNAPEASQMLSRARLPHSGESNHERAGASTGQQQMQHQQGSPVEERMVQLDHLLRSHRTKTVYGREVELRDAFDELLEYYSLLEIGCLARVIPDEFEADARRHAVWELGQPSLRRYYTEHYPLLLPRLFLRRMETGKGPEIPLPEDASARYARFLDLNALLRKDESVDTFLWFLDEGFLDDSYSIKSVLAVLRDPEELMRCLMRDPGDGNATPLERGVEGFRTFLGFCADFDTFLQSGAKYPELHSAFWHYHGYWFRNINALVGPLMHEAIDNLMSWNAELAASGPDDGDRGLIDAQAKQLHASIDRLTSDRYARPLEVLA